MSHLTPASLRVVRQEWAERVVSPAYDAMTPSTRREWAARNPDSYLNVTRSPEDLPAPATVTPVDLAELGRESLERILAKGAFGELGDPGVYVYQLQTLGHTQTAVLSTLDADEFDDGVHFHEETRPGRVEMLAQHLATVGHSSSPVALAFKASEQVLGVFDDVVQAQPLVEFVSENAVRHCVWRASPDQAAVLITALDDTEVYLLDGHHRVGAAIWQKRHGRPGAVLVAAFPDHQLQVLPIDRWLSLDDRAAGGVLADIGAQFSVEPIAASSLQQARPTSPGSVAMWLGQRWYSVDLAIPADLRLGESLDVVRLRDRILVPLLGVADADLVYLPDVGNGELERRCLEEPNSVAFVMAPMPIDDLFGVARSGEMLPPKSTFFHPKVRSGLFLMPMVAQ